MFLEDRKWQVDAKKCFYEKIVVQNEKIFSFGVAQGSGKTYVNASFAKLLLEKESIDNIVYIVPTNKLKEQVIKCFASFGIELIGCTRSTINKYHNQKHGIVLCYQSLIRYDFLLEYTFQKKVALFLDECHFLGVGENDKTFTACANFLRQYEIFEKVILCSGTPNRNTAVSPLNLNPKIPLIAYDNDNIPKLDFVYDSRSGIIDEIILPYEVCFVDVEMENLKKVDENKTKINSLEKYNYAVKCKGHLNNLWINILKQAQSRLEHYRKYQYKYAQGVIFAPDYKTAKAIAHYLGKKADIVSSYRSKKENENAFKKLKNKTIDWIVNVKMINVGFDYPDLKVLVYCPSAMCLNIIDVSQTVNRITRTINKNNEKIRVLPMVLTVSYSPLIEMLKKDQEGSITVSKQDLIEWQPDYEKEKKELAEKTDKRKRLDSLRQKVSPEDYKEYEKLINQGQLDEIEYNIIISRSSWENKMLPESWQMKTRPKFQDVFITKNPESILTIPHQEGIYHIVNPRKSFKGESLRYYVGQSHNLRERLTSYRLDDYFVQEILKIPFEELQHFRVFWYTTTDPISRQNREAIDIFQYCPIYNKRQEKVIELTA